MIPKALLVTMVVGVVASAGFIYTVHHDNTRLRRRLAETRQRETGIVRLREANQQTRAIIDHSKSDSTRAAEELRAHVTRLRAQVESLEKRAHDVHVATERKSAQEAAELASNRDPRVGWVRLEQFTDAGRATPEAALQTLIWSALKGKDAELAAALTLSPAAREKTQGLISGLPDAARSQWTPEKLAALFFTGLFNEVSAVKIEDGLRSDGRQARVTLRLSDGARETVVPLDFEASAEGWRTVLPEQAVGALQKRLATALP